MKATVRVTLAWLSTTPRGLPVLPEVYWMKAVSVSARVGKAGAGPPQSRARDGAQAQGAEEGEEDLLARGIDEADLVAAVDARPAEPGGVAGAFLPELAVGDRLVVEVEVRRV